MGKGEIARYEQFHLFQQCFQKACFPGASKGVTVWEWVKGILAAQIKECTRQNINLFNPLLLNNQLCHGEFVEKKKKCVRRRKCWLTSITLCQL